jgi:hypothetical protein
MPWKILPEGSRRGVGGLSMLCRRSWGVLAGRVRVGRPAPFRRSRRPLANGVKVGLLAAAVAAAGSPRPALGQELEEGASPPGRSWTVLPFASYMPETSLSFGALLAWIQGEPGEPGRVRTSLMINAQYTLKSQMVAGVLLESRPRPEWFILADGAVKLRWPDRFYQPGNKTPRDAHEAWTSRGWNARGRFLRQMAHPSLFVGPLVGLSSLELLEVEEGGLLDLGGIRGARDHGFVGLGLVATWDSRSSPVYPRSGSYHSMSLAGYRSFRGPEARVGRGEVDLRSYRSLGPSTVLAVRGRLRGAWGDVPFTMHSAIGGTGGGLRGIFENRYADRTAVVGLVELRQSLIGRAGCVVFGGIGEVASSPGKLTLGGLHGSAGAGLRFTLLPASGLNLGVDFAMGEGGSGLYFLLGEVF